jgi:lysozyme family protein
MNFDQAFDIVIGHEGGYSNNQADPGGETKYGISKRAYPLLDIASLTLNDAKAIYLRDYWQALKCNELPDAIRYPLFDAAVNAGVITAAKWLQMTLKVTVDGVIGPHTIAAAQSAGEKTVRQMLGLQLDFKTRLPTWPTFGAGWSRRIATILMGA